MIDNFHSNCSLQVSRRSNAIQECLVCYCWKKIEALFPHATKMNFVIRQMHIAWIGTKLSRFECNSSVAQIHIGILILFKALARVLGQKYWVYYKNIILKCIVLPQLFIPQMMTMLLHHHITGNLTVILAWFSACFSLFYLSILNIDEAYQDFLVISTNGWHLFILLYLVF